MSNLISDFVFNPVLRQARRFSRPNTTRDPTEDTNQQAGLNSKDETATSGITGQVESQDRSETKAGEIARTCVHPSPSALEENERLACGLEEQQGARVPATTLGQTHMAPLRMSSDSGHAESEVSDDLSVGLRDGGADRMSSVDDPSMLSTQDPAQSEPATRNRNNSLPADDGMSALRQKILRIQALVVPSEQKAQLMHRLLAQEYYRSQDVIHAKDPPRSSSPESMISQERPTSPASLSSFLWHMNGVVDDPSPEEVQHTFHLSPDDLKRTYAPLEPMESDEEGVPLGCQHYRRNVKLQCSTCERWYTCRLCHDDVEDHVLIRHATKNMLCMLCGCAQRAGEFCVECGERTAWYYCGVCKLWDNDPNKSIYHCNDCGICRKGRGLGKDFFHCKRCGVCMSVSVEHSHKCIERVSDCDCPICGEYMFSSPRPVVFMACGHSIHQTCYYEHMKSSYRCPICSKSTVNMETHFRNLDRAIDNQPMPSEFRDTQAMVSCNDCCAKSAVKYHWLGLKCAICDSYNTVQLSILSDPDVAVPGMENREAVSGTVTEQGDGELSSSALLIPPPRRRHSSYMHPAEGVLEIDGLPPYSVPQRIARSVSPMHRRGFLDSVAALLGGETDESEADDDDLDFWGRDGPRSSTTAEIIEDDIEDTDSDESASVADDCEEGEDEDQFELLGHR